LLGSYAVPSPRTTGASAEEMAVLQTEHRSAPRNASDARTPRLVVPAGLLVDDVTRGRLGRQLARAPEGIAGIVAELNPLPPGSSYRVHAEWKALEPIDATKTAPSNTIRGAALLREGVAWTVRDDRVEVHNGSLIVDAGAHVHDPNASLSALAAAEAHGRSPFPRRPIVTFLATTAEARVADWARRLVNRLMPRDIEPRLLLPAMPDGLHLTRPATPTETSVRALWPDAVVALDDDAIAAAHEWCRENRSTVVIAFDRTLTTTMELVPWQIDRAAGRLRARIGPLVDAPALASLIRRMCAGPHPGPPRGDATRTSVAIALRHSERAAAARTCAIVTGDIEDVTRRRLNAMSDHMQAAGMTTATFSVAQELPDGVADASLVILSGSGLSAGVSPLVAARREHGLPTVLDLQPRDIVVNDSGAVLVDDAASRALACGLVTSFGGALHRAAVSLGVRALAIPTMLTRRQAAELRAARTSFDPSDLVIGWSLGTLNEAGASCREAVATALAKVTTEHPRLRVDAGCEPTDLPPRVPSQVRANGNNVWTPAEIAAWHMHLFTPALIDDSSSDDVLPFTDAGQAGVPTIMPSGARPDVYGFVASALIVDDPSDPEQWSTALLHALESPQRRIQFSTEARQRADAVNSAPTSQAMMNRLVGWARAGALL